MSSYYFQNLFFNLIVVSMILTPIFLILRNWVRSKDKQQRFENELRSIGRQWEEKK